MPCSREIAVCLIRKILQIIRKRQTPGVQGMRGGDRLIPLIDCEPCPARGGFSGALRPGSRIPFRRLVNDA